jgi:hypothetical protein
MDLLDHAFEGELTAERAHSLTAAEVEHLAGAVGDVYERWTPPQPGPNEAMTLYSGGWTARNFMGPGRAHLLTSLVYSPSVLIHDPVAEWFDAGRGKLTPLPGIPSALKNNRGVPAMIVNGGEPTLTSGDGYYVAGDDRVERSRQHLAQVVPALAEIGPLIRSGVAVLVPELLFMRQYEQELLSAVRFDVKDNRLADLVDSLNRAGDPPARSNFVRGAGVTPSGGVAKGHEARALVQDPSYYFHKTVAISAAMSAHYVPTSGADAALLEYRLRQLGERLSAKTNRNAELRLLPALVAAELPFLQEVDPALLLTIREDALAFQEWRVELRNAVRVVESLPSEGAVFEAEARDVLRDSLLPRAAAVRKAVSLSDAMKDATKESFADFVISASAIGYTAAALGPAGLAAVVTEGIAAPLRWLYKVAFRPTPAGANGVLAKLVQRQ